MIGVERVLTKAGQLLLKSTCRTKNPAILSASSSPVQCFINGNCSPLPVVVPVRFNSNRTSICRINRLQYLRHYPTTVVNPDGSTYTIRYTEPRQIIKLPVDINSLSEPERKKHLERRKPKTKVSLEEDFEDIEFDASKYLKLVKKK